MLPWTYPESTYQTACRSVQPLFHSSRQGVPIQRAVIFPLKIATSHGPPCNIYFNEPTRVHNPNGISISSAACAGLMIVTGRETDRQTTLLPSVTVGCIYIRSTAMRPKNNRYLQNGRHLDRRDLHEVGQIAGLRRRRLLNTCHQTAVTKPHYHFHHT